MPLTRDRIRLVNGTVDYNTYDSWNGYNDVSATLSQGVGWLGASSARLPHLSRAEADPESTTFNFSYTREQSITDGWQLKGDIAGQVASDPLFSSEEFGYGGQRFGRAYDPSEITGDNGIAASVELRYLGITPRYETYMIPFAFYDQGKVWNLDTNGADADASSAGLGAHIIHESGVEGMVGLAWPLGKKIENPIYGNSGSPRLMAQLSFKF